MDSECDISAEIVRKLDKHYARFFGFEVVSARPGAVSLALCHRSDFEFAPGYFEGAITSALGQIAASYSGSSASNPSWAHRVLQQSVRFVAAAQGERLIAHGRVIQAGREISFTAADIYVDRAGSSQLCACLDMTMRHSPPRN